MSAKTSRTIIAAGVAFAVAMLLTVAAIEAWMPTAIAQCGGRISYGSTITGNIPRTGTSCQYSFQGSTGDVITIQMTKSTSSLDPYLELKDPRGDIAVSDDDSAGNRNSLISDFRLNSTGNYSIIARGYDDASLGSFTLKLIEGGATACGGDISPGYWQPGRVGRPGEACEYSFYGYSGDVASIYMKAAIASNLDPWLDLEDPLGYTVASDDDSYGNHNSLIESQYLRRTGYYTIVAGSYSGQSAGEFELYLSLR